MSKNEGTIDRVIRAIVGIIIIYFTHASLSGTWALAGYVVGIVALLTAITGYCHLYKIIGISTKK